MFGNKEKDDMFSMNSDTKQPMIQTFHAGKSVDDLAKSEERRELLENLAIMNTGRPVYVQVQGKRAYADIAKRDSAMGYTDRTIINVPAEIPDQAITSYDDETWALLFQKAELYHELGHVLYTDWPSFEDVLFGHNGNSGVEMDFRPFFKDIWNILEDATIERLLADRFNIKKELRIKNENLLRQQSTNTMVSLHEAVLFACMNYKHPVGWIDELMDPAKSTKQFLTDDDRDTFETEIKPEIDSRVPDVLAEPHPGKRAELVGELFDAIKDPLDGADAPSEGERITFGQPDDSEKNDGSDGQEAPENAMPDPDADGADGIGTDSDGAPEGDVSVPNMDADVQREYEDEIENHPEPKDDTDEKVERTGEWLRVIDTDYDLGTDMELLVPDGSEFRNIPNDGRDQEAKRLSKPLKREFAQRLRKQQKTKKAKGQKSGKVDSKNAHKSAKGETNIFKRTVDPDEKDYNCIILVDRSGSMSGMVKDVEEASGSLATALEDIGVEVAQLSVFGGSVLLEKDFGEDMDTKTDTMFHGSNAGGTPFSDALALARERLESKGGNNFVIALTDGQPDNRERYRDQLHQCNFPVLGIYIDSAGDFADMQGNENAYFHALELCKPDEVLNAARDMAKRVMF